MRRKRTILLMTALLLCLFSISAAAEELLLNGGFEDVTDGSFDSWSRGMWISDMGVSYIEVSEDAYEGRYCALVENCEENDARLEQEVKVKPDTVYRISCMVNASGCPQNAKGATISIKDTTVTSESAYDTNGTWQELVLYGRTGKKQTQLCVMARVGGYSSTNTGRALFDCISMTEAEEVPDDMPVYSFALPESNNSGNTFLRNDGPSSLLSLLLNLGFAGIAAFLLILTRNGTLTWSKKRFFCVLGASFLLRLVLAVCVRGLNSDMNCFMLWSQRICETKPWGFYNADYFCDYPPGYMWVLWLSGTVNNLFGGGYDTRVFWLLIKLPAILCDMGTALLLAKSAREKQDDGLTRCIALLYAFCPAVFLNSAAWGQIDSIWVFLLLAAVMCMMRGKWSTAVPLYALSIAVKPQALMFGPIALAYLVVRAVQACKKKDIQTLLDMGAGLLLCFTALLAIWVPFVTDLPMNTQPHGLAYIFTLYGGTMSRYWSFTVNAYNLYYLIDLNWADMDTNMTLVVFGYVMLGLSVLYSCFLAARSRENRAMLVCGMFMCAVFAICPMMHERYLFPAAALLCAAYAQDRDRRIPIAAVVSAFTLGVNETLVLQFNAQLPRELIWVGKAMSAVNVANALLLLWTGFDICVREKCYAYVRIYERRSTHRRTPEDRAPFRILDYRMNFTRRDALLMTAIMLAYSVLTFCNLGSHSAPQSGWTSSASDETVTFDLGETKSLRMTYYGGITSASFDVEYSVDGTAWTEKEDAKYGEGEIFRWKWHRNNMTDARYVRLTAHRAGLILYEVGFLDADGNVLPVSSMDCAGSSETRYCDAQYLLDEQDTVPPAQSWYNSTYFDEIYHARTGFELLNGEHNYEWTHPPLGKLFIMCSIRAFGMTPFGWRFAGALSGVLMLGVMYLLCKQLFKRTDLAVFGTFLLAVDCMHFTQTRIATIDTFVVLFIMAEYLFMFRYMQMSFYRQRLQKTLLPLGLSGLCMGLGIACKWTGIYAGMGLAVLFLITLGKRIYEAMWVKKHPDALEGDMKKLGQRAARQCVKNTCLTLLWCVLVFVIVPALIYYFSYARQLQPDGGLSLQRVWDLQQTMFGYHKGLSTDTHFFRSPWYEWPLIVRPIWYFSGYDYTPYEVVSSISCMGNPVVWWGGLAAVLFTLYYAIFGKKGDRRALIVVIGYFAQYLPWILVPRSTFIYHYFACVPFLILATVLAADALRRHIPEGAYKACIWGYAALALALFVMFYPIASGVEIPRSYANLLRWFNWHNFS